MKNPSTNELRKLLEDFPKFGLTFGEFIDLVQNICRGLLSRTWGVKVIGFASGESPGL